MSRLNAKNDGSEVSGDSAPKKVRSFVFISLAMVIAIIGVSEASFARGGGRGSSLSASSSSGSSDWKLGLAYSMMNSKTTSEVSNTSTSSESNDSRLIFKLGTNFPSGWYLGGIAYNRTDDWGGAKTNGNALGVSLGYDIGGGFFLHGHYYFSASYGDDNEGSGYGADFGYQAMVSGSVYLGVQLSYTSLKYSKNVTISGYQSKTQVETYPALILGVAF